MSQSSASSPEPASAQKAAMKARPPPLLPPPPPPKSERAETAAAEAEFDLANQKPALEPAEPILAETPQPQPQPQPQLDPETAEQQPATELTCWVCCEGSDELLVTGCACRGSSGLAHLRCLVAAAQHDVESWTTCPTCGQYYTGAVDVGLSRARWRLVCARPPDDVRFQCCCRGQLPPRSCLLQVLCRELVRASCRGSGGRRICARASCLGRKNDCSLRTTWQLH